MFDVFGVLRGVLVLGLRPIAIAHLSSQSQVPTLSTQIQNSPPLVPGADGSESGWWTISIWQLVSRVHCPNLVLFYFILGVFAP